LTYVLATATGLFYSTQTQTWRRILSSIAQGPYTEVKWKNGRFFAIGDSSYYSDDNAQTWHTLIKPEAGRQLTTLAASVADSIVAIRNSFGERVVAFITDAGIVQSRKEGVGDGNYSTAVDSNHRPWTSLFGTMQHTSTSVPLAYSTGIGDTNWHTVPTPGIRSEYLFGTAKGLIAITGNNYSSHYIKPYSYRVYLSADSGMSWQIGNTISLDNVQFFADSSGLLYRGTNDGQLSESSDLGATWRVIPAAFPKGLPIIALRWRGRFIAASRGVFQSLDNGVTWSQIDDGSLTSDVISLKRTDSVLVAGTASGLFFSRDGVSWVRLSGSFNPNSLATSRSSIAVARDSLILRSADNGMSWEQLRYRDIHDVAVDSIGGMFVGSSRGMVYFPPRSTSYVTIDDSLGDRDIAHIAMLPSGTLFVSKNGEGIYRAFGSLPQAGIVAPSQPSQRALFPNPAASVMHVQLTSGIRSATAYDALGRAIELNILGDSTLDVRALPNGPYFLRIVCDASPFSAEFIVKH
jgi:hypothetical protein